MPETPSLFDLLKADAMDAWISYTDHAFVRAMGDGSLPKPAFQHYLVQDYLFLIHFARAYALAAYKARSLAEVREASEGLKAIVDVELDLHVGLCAKWGLSPADLEAAPEARATMAYTRYVLETGLRGDLLDLHVALSPCVVGYAEVATTLEEAPRGRDETNPYRPWIAEYAGAAYQEVAAHARARLDRLAGGPVSDTRFAQLLTIFIEATRLEAEFWQMGLDQSL